MKPGPILLFVVLAVGGGLLLYRTNTSGSTPDGPKGGLPAAAPAAQGPAAVLSNEESTQARSSGAANAVSPGTPLAEAVKSAQRTAEAAAAEQAAAGGEDAEPREVEGSLPSVRPRMKPSADERELAERYASATSAELMSAYKALHDYYQMHFDGRITDKNERLAPEALEALVREMAWLKERAINGNPDSDG